MTPDLIRSLPRDTLLFYVAQPITPEIREEVRAFVARLQARRVWMLGTPKLVEVTESLISRIEDEPIETLGAQIEVCSARIPGGLPKNVDASFYEEVSDLVEAVREFSERSTIAFDFMYGGTFVGEIEDGEVDRTLQVGLLDEWRKHLGQ